MARASQSRPTAALPQPTMGAGERALYVIAGLGLAAAGVKPRPNPLLNVLALLGGSYLAWRGAVGTDPVRQAIAARIPDNLLTRG